MVREMSSFINRYKVLSLFSRPANYFAVSFDPFLTRKTTKATGCTGSNYDIAVFAVKR